MCTNCTTNFFTKVIMLYGYNICMDLLVHIVVTESHAVSCVCKELCVSIGTWSQVTIFGCSPISDIHDIHTYIYTHPTCCL